MVVMIQVFCDVRPCQLVKSDNVLENFNVEQWSCEDLLSCTIQKLVDVQFVCGSIARVQCSHS